MKSKVSNIIFNILQLLYINIINKHEKWYNMTIDVEKQSIGITLKDRFRLEGYEAIFFHTSRRISRIEDDAMLATSEFGLAFSIMK